MNILSIQSSVTYGHVGNAAAVFPLQRLGAEVWTIDTVQFSNHPGYGKWTGQVATAALIGDLLAGLAGLGVLESCDAVLSGYMGEAAVGAAIVDAVASVRHANPDALYCCDPVMGDAGQLYVRAGIPELIAARALPQADLLTPNQFELEHLAGFPCQTAADVRSALAALRGRMRPPGPRAVLVTSLRTLETPSDMLDAVAADDAGCTLLRAPLLPIAASGAGDVVAGLFLYHYLRARSAAAAMAAACSAIHGVLRRTAAAGSRELLLIAAQEELVRPADRLATRNY